MSNSWIPAREQQPFSDVDGVRMPGVNRNSRSWLTWLAANSVEAYVFAISLSGAAALLRLGNRALGSHVTPVATFYPAMLFAALVGGFWPGLLVVVCGALISWWAFLPDLSIRQL
jgi:Domain of unknown function (DUF4118)